MEGSNNDPAPIAGVKRSAPEEAATTGLDNTPVDFSETDAAVSPAFKEARVGDAVRAADAVSRGGAAGAR